MNAKELSELADRLADITEDAHGNPKPIDLSDRQEAARQLRLMAKVEAERQLYNQSTLELGHQYAELKRAYHQKIQDWWWRLHEPYPDGSLFDLAADMESFMRERGVPLERPK